MLAEHWRKALSQQRPQQHDDEPVRPTNKHPHGMDARDDFVRVARPDKADEPACRTTRAGGDHKASFHRSDAHKVHSTDPRTITSVGPVLGSVTLLSNHATKETENGSASRFSTGPEAVRNAVQSGVCNWAWTEGKPTTRAIQLSALKDTVDNPDGAEVRCSHWGKAPGGGSEGSKPERRECNTQADQARRYSCSVLGAFLAMARVRSSRGFGRDLVCKNNVQRSPRSWTRSQNMFRK